MNDAVVTSLPDFRGYLRTKARLLGHAAGLPWWDLFAPATGADELRWSDATALVATAFDGYSPSLSTSPTVRSRSSGSTPRSATASEAARTACG